MSKTFAVIGDPIDHSLSPNIHGAAFRELDLDCTYIAYRIPKGELKEGIDALKKIKIDGFNVTIPHKVEMMKYLDKIDESCSIIGAVNTVTNNDGILKGYNTDMDGFLDPFKKKKIKIQQELLLQDLPRKMQNTLLLQTELLKMQTIWHNSQIKLDWMQMPLTLKMLETI